jgi:hypothetical protein
MGLVNKETMKLPGKERIVLEFSLKIGRSKVALRRAIVGAHLKNRYGTVVRKERLSF